MGTAATGRAQDPGGCRSAEAAACRGAPAALNTYRQQGACVAGGKSNASAPGSNSCCATSNQSSGGRPQRPSGTASQEQGGEGQAPAERDALLVLLPRLGW